MFLSCFCALLMTVNMMKATFSFTQLLCIVFEKDGFGFDGFGSGFGSVWQNWDGFGFTL